MGSCVVVVFLAYFFERCLLRSVVMKLKGLFSNLLVLVTTGHKYGLDVLVSLVPWFSWNQFWCFLFLSAFILNLRHRFSLLVDKLSSWVSSSAV